MAKAPKAAPKGKDGKKDGKNKGPVYLSEFGSHTGMINAELTPTVVEAKQNTVNPWQILTDERGNYATMKSRIDSGMADPNRCADQSAREKAVKDLTNA